MQRYERKRSVMTREEVLEKVNEVFRDVFDNESIVVNDSTTANDIEDWDSLNHITLISSIASEFGINFAMKDIVGFQNVGDMINCIMEKICK